MENSIATFDRIYDDLTKELQTLQSQITQLRNNADFFKIDCISKQITLITTIQSNLIKVKRLKQKLQNDS